MTEAGRSAGAQPSDGPAGTPWRWLPWALLGVLVAVGLPLHVCMPLWCDAVFYDVSAMVLLRGELLYREVFYYLLPGMAFLHAGVRALLGWSSEVLRGFDLAVALAVISLLAFRILPGPARHPVRIWTALLLLFVYLGTTEFSHVQPDTWMLAPALLALALRTRQARELVDARVDTARLARRSLLEGLCWALAFLIKPVVLLPALACFLVTALRAVRSPVRAPARRVSVDAVAGLAGGGLVGVAVTLWLVGSGNWPDFWSNLGSGWFGAYRETSLGWLQRAGKALALHPPWGASHLVAVPLALLLLRDALRRPDVPGSRGRTSLGLLAVFYLSWFFTAHFVQFQLAYHALPPILLALTLVVGYAWQPRASRAWAVALAALVVLALPSHPLLQPSRLALWPRCWTDGATASVRDALALETGFHAAASYVELERVAAYLRSRDVTDREVTCHSLSSLSLYTDLDLLPSSRFVQLWTLLITARERRGEILAALASGPQRFVVSDLRAPPLRLEAGPHSVRLPARVLEQFPFDLPIVFRSGRYLVHRVPGAAEPPFRRPPGPLTIPASVPETGRGL